MRKLSVFLVIALIFAMTTVFVRPVSANTTVVEYQSANPSCADLGYAYGLKFDNLNGPFDPTIMTLAGMEITAWSTDGVHVSWSSNLGVDVVIVKGGDNAFAYSYSPEAFSDSFLVSPINKGGNVPLLSHVDFCFDFEVKVSKTATTSFTRTWNWDIKKSALPSTLDLFKGDAGSTTWTIDVTRTGYVDSDWAVMGDITITNPAPVAATVTSVIDQMSDGATAAVVCPENLVIPSMGSLVCTYSAGLSSGAERINTATVATARVTTSDVGGGSGTANVIFTDPTTKVNETVTVSDRDYQWKFAGTGSQSFTEQFTCNNDAGSHTNTAVINQTGQSAAAEATVNCYELSVSKTAKTDFTREWDWTIAKTAGVNALTLSVGQVSPLVTYTVTVTPTSKDYAHTVSGEITIKNPAPMDAPLSGVIDLSGAVTCTSMTVPAGDSLVCSYTLPVADASSFTNIAIAIMTNGVAYTGTKDVVFDPTPSTELDECVDVTDSLQGALGTACKQTASYTYDLTVGPYDVCGNYNFVNVASFLSNDQGKTGSDDHTIAVTIPCGGCTLTQGYWKTHSIYGPAAHPDDTWNLVGGPDAIFYLSNITWYNVFWTNPAGDAYYNLAHQYMAAKLNILNGASTTPAVDAALAYAEKFFSTNYPTTTKIKLAEVTKNASILDQYNNGLIGPGHCSE